jgi:hypothetical protein
LDETAQTPNPAQARERKVARKGLRSYPKPSMILEKKKINLKWKPGTCNHGISISRACVSRGCGEICSAITLQKA